jgi:hypothetical protein
MHHSACLPRLPVFRVIEQAGHFRVDWGNPIQRMLEFVVTGVLFHNGNDGAEVHQNFRYPNVKAEPLVQFIVWASPLTAALFQSDEQSGGDTAIYKVVGEMPEVLGQFHV